MHCHFLKRIGKGGADGIVTTKGVHLIDRTIDLVKSFTRRNVNQGRKCFQTCFRASRQPTVLVPTCFPIEAVAAAADYARRHDIQLILFSDPFADNVSCASNAV